jgi:outer membrane protein
MSPLRIVLPICLAAALSSPATAQHRTDSLRLTLQDAVTRVLRESDEVRLAAAQLEVTDALVTTARASGLPQARLSGSYTQVLKNARAAIVGQAIFGQNYNYTSNINVSQVLFQGGRVFAGSRAAGDVREASRLSLAETKAQLAVDAQRSYLGAVLARQLEQIQTQNASLLDARLAQVQQLEKAGRAARYDVLRARVERANLEPTLLQARNNRELADISLRQLLNIRDDAPLALVSEIDTAAMHVVVQRIAADSSGTASRSVERAAQRTLDARREGVRVARADLMPTITTFFQTGYTALPSSNGFPTVWGFTSAANCASGTTGRVCQNNGWFPDRQFGVQVAWPLFDGLRTKGNIDLAQAQEKLARTQLEQARERVHTEQASAEAEFSRAEAAYEAQKQNAAEADEAFRIASLRFDRGLGTQLEVSDAQLLLLTARTNAARATIDYYLAAAELARARGLEIPLPPTR